MNSDSALGYSCIYCSNSRAFTDEHVFPAGMGGNDQSYILRNLVCGHCNTVVFSPLEAQLMRNSPFALARLHQQPTGRMRGSKGAPPKFVHDRCEMIDENGRVSEAQLMAGGKPQTLPQIQIFGDEVNLVGNESSEIETFLEELLAVLGEIACVINKIADAQQARFEITKYQWDGHDYQFAGLTVQSTAPPLGIWLNSLVGSSGKATGWPRIFKRARGQVVLRVTDPGDAAAFLSGTKRTLPKLVSSPIPASRLVDRPLMMVSMRAEPEKIFRAMAKIGVNFACHEYGHEVVRLNGFDLIREIILHGTGGVPLTDMPEAMGMFSNDKRPAHFAMLYPQRIGDNYALVFLLQLYRTGIHMFLLSREVSLPKTAEPVVFTIHYLENRIERSSMTEYVSYLTTQMRRTSDPDGQIIDA